MKLKNEKELKKHIRLSIIKHFYNMLVKATEEIKQKIAAYNVAQWQLTDTYDSLINGDLNHQFGFHEGSAKRKVDAVLHKIANRIKVIPKINGRGKNPELLRIIIIQYGRVGSDVLDSRDALIPIRPTKNRTHIPWLRWLLFYGNSYLIKNYAYLDITSDSSRSGRGIMIPEEGAWKIPSKYTGTANSNWLSRTFEENRQLIETAYRNIIKSALESPDMTIKAPVSNMRVVRKGNIKYVYFDKESDD